MTRFATAILCAAALSTGSALAVEPSPGVRLGTSLAEIEQALAKEGYELRAFEREDDRFEVRAVRDDRRLELRVDPESGEVLRVETRLRRGAEGRDDDMRRRGAENRAGMSDAAIRAGLEADGYVVREYERERGRVEVEALRDGRRVELHVDPRTGDVLRSERDDR